MSSEPFQSHSKAVVVTGGLGFIGGHLVAHLLKTGIRDIRVIDNRRRAVFALESWPNSRVKLFESDIRELSALVAAMQGAEHIFHLAAQSNVLGSIHDPDYTFTTNVIGTINVLEAARVTGVKRIVFTSSREVYGSCDRTPTKETAPLRPKNPYGASKAAAEMYCLMVGGAGDSEVCILRLANVYGPWDKDRVVPLFIRAALDGEPLVLFGGDQVVDFIWIDRVVDALMRIGFGEYIPGPMNIGSGVGITIAELANRVLRLAGSKCGSVRQPPRSAEVSCFVADVHGARQLIGFPTIIDSLDHLPQLVKWFHLDYA
jgi:UDP-glucose 4-epimerase